MLILLLAALEEMLIPTPPSAPIEAVVLHPFTAKHFQCGDHAADDSLVPGDSLGTDCQVLGPSESPRRSFLRLYRTDGRTNADWYSWGETVLAPVDGRVIAVLVNDVVNRPGTKGKPPAGTLFFERADGVRVAIGHVDGVLVKKGDRVRAGQPVARIGNNGPSWAPHVHIGAWRGKTGLQVRWDQRAIGKAAVPR